MKKFHVFQPILPDEVYKAIRAAGSWTLQEDSDNEVVKAYLGITSMLSANTAEKLAESLVATALSLDLYNLQYIVSGPEVCDAENVFSVLNGIPSVCEVLYRVPQSKSMSVGDVLIDVNSKKGEICMAFGWAKLPSDLVAKFLEIG